MLSKFAAMELGWLKMLNSGLLIWQLGFGEDMGSSETMAAPFLASDYYSGQLEVKLWPLHFCPWPLNLRSLLSLHGRSS